MTDEAQATPRDTPNPDSQQPSLKTPKDKNCPFCGQAFTSSSLGRHLDLYIRPKNPKPADGVHLVDEIRKIRGGITRRQVKGPLKKEQSDTPKRLSVVVGDGPHSPAADSGDDDDSLDLSTGKRRDAFKDVTWGGASAKTPDMRRDMSRQLQKAELEQRHRMSDEAETAKATELALRELLRSVKAANAKATGPTLFDFDPYTLNFPSLCLRILPPPSTLFSPTPFPTSESWSITPPGQKQFDTLNRQVQERLLAHHQQRQVNQAYPSGSRSNPGSGQNSPLPTPPLFDPDPEKLFCHIADAYNHWIHQPEQARQEFWQVEILRSYARANDLRQETEINLANARREIEYLKSNRWASDLSPVSFTLGTETVKELGKLGMDFRNWDYDRLIEKWKTAVRENKHLALGMAAQKPLPHETSSRSCSMASLPSQTFASVNGPRSGVKVEQMAYSAPPTISGREPSSDQADAEGDEDDADVDLEVVPASNNVTMGDMHHGLPLQPTPVHPAQMHAHLQSQVHAQQQMQAQAQAQAHAQLSQAQAQAQAQAWAVARQHMNHSRNSHHAHPHQHQQLSPHPQHMGSTDASRRQSSVLMDPHAMSAGGMLPMDGIESHDQFLRMDMGLTAGFVGSNADTVL
ncbi:hypothetical protein P280DRAFT_300218 [Massarina eburnea CBS 473.64]|uniref:Uncharacterized protein n=1 Tax=Massarina eburnea CBS 473.64 TaxID=1395130 RepID=A0A6A6S3P2_9PLEO|nr:hypothetical protein P280DRAFT_300218 [Massarina eburnea CBS 473.64]